MHGDADVLEYDAVTGRKSDLPAFVAKALRTIDAAGAPYAVVGAMALAARGLPRMTRDLDVVVSVDDAFAILDALEAAAFRSVTPVDRSEPPEAMYVLEHDQPRGELDVLVAALEPECTIIGEAERAELFGVEARVASLEHLLLMYLYSNQPKHSGDFARIVTEAAPDLAWVERYLADVHPEMLPELSARVAKARTPPPPPVRPRKKRIR
jgi:hypothetical protein